MVSPGKRSRWQIRLAALIIFLLGFAGGMLALRAYNTWAGSRAPVSRPGDRFAEMLKRLELTEEQETQVRAILGETREKLQALRRESEPQVIEIRRQADERMQEVLTAEQWEQFRKMREERRDRGRRNRGR